MKRFFLFSSILAYQIAHSQSTLITPNNGGNGNFLFKSTGANYGQFSTTAAGASLTFRVNEPVANNGSTGLITGAIYSDATRTVLAGFTDSGQLYGINKVEIGTNAVSNRMVMNNTGGVGIGVINPITRLDVNGPILTRNRVVFGNQNGNDPAVNPVWVIDNFNNDFRLFQQPNFYSVGAVRLTVQNSTGNVGIGSFSPNHHFEVAQTGNAMPGWGSYIKPLKICIAANGNHLNTNESYDAIGVAGYAADAGSSNNNIGIMGTTGVSGYENNAIYGYQNGIFNNGSVCGLRTAVYQNGNQNAYGIYSVVGSDYSPFRCGIYAQATGLNSVSGYFKGKVIVEGDLAYTGTFSGPSDEKLKKAINPMENALDKILGLNPSTYEYRVDEYLSMNLAKGNHYGFTAQGVQKVLPELVSEKILHNVSSGNLNDQTTTSYLSVNYIEIIPVLTKAIQEQQEMIKELQTEILKLKK